jgi:tRNA 2-thiocytidine biosynthesis protein TtcA
VPSHLADHQLCDFKSIDKDSGIIDGGDLAFDKAIDFEVPAADEGVVQFDPALNLDVKNI